MSPPMLSDLPCPRCGATSGAGDVCLRCAATDLAGSLTPRPVAAAALPIPDISHSFRREIIRRAETIACGSARFPVTPEHPAVGIFASHAQFFCAPVTGNFAGPEARDADWPHTRPTGNAGAFPRTAPAVALPANAHGFHHLAGNVAEWVLLPGPENSETAEPETAAVGGSWSTLASEWTMDAGMDSSRGPRRRASDIGFRCVLVTGK